MKLKIFVLQIFWRRIFLYVTASCQQLLYLFLLSSVQRCEAAITQYNHYGVFSWFFVKCYLYIIFMLLLVTLDDCFCYCYYFFLHVVRTVLLSWIIFIPISIVFHICACYQNPKMSFFCWLMGKNGHQDK